MFLLQVSERVSSADCWAPASSATQQAASRSAARATRGRKQVAELGHVSRRASRRGNAPPSTHRACQLVARTHGDVRRESRTHSLSCARTTVCPRCCCCCSCCCVRSCPALCLISPPVARLRCLHQEPSERRGELWKGINPDWHVKWGWIFVLQCPLCPEWLACTPPCPHPLHSIQCAYNKGEEGFNLWSAPPLQRSAPLCSQVGARSCLG